MKSFRTVEGRRLRKNMFNLSHEVKMTGQMGVLYPIFHTDVLPGDHFRVNSEIMVRLSPLIAPIYHRVNVFVHYFFVPNRLIWDEWEDFITGGKDGLSAPILPHSSMQAPFGTAFGQGSLADYLGLNKPDTLAGAYSPKVSVLPLRAYQEIYNQYYRDQNIIAEKAYGKTSGVQGPNADLTELRRRAWDKDYFTSAQVQAQKGPQVQLPADINYETGATVKKSDGTAVTSSGSVDYTPLGSLIGQAGDATGIRIENIESLGITINDLRASNSLQRFLERMQRGGSRLTEVILQHFGVQSSDARLNRPEYLGGGKSPVVISEVLNTTGPTADPSTAAWTSPQGSYAGHGIAVGNTNRFKRRFEEHGHVMGIMSILPKCGYMTGIGRAWTKETKEEFFWPDFAHLGEQEVKGAEIFYNGIEAEDNATFGYQERYAEYKYMPDRVAGDFKGNLKQFHLHRDFQTRPQLNEDFINNNPSQRIFAVTDESVDKLLVNVYNNVKAKRPIPIYSTPRL